MAGPLQGWWAPGSSEWALDACGVCRGGRGLGRGMEGAWADWLSSSTLGTALACLRDKHAGPSPEAGSAV